MSRPMKDILVDLIQKEAYRSQYIHECAIDIKQRQRPEKFSELTIATKEITPKDLFHGEGKVGIIIWLDRKDVMEE